MSDDRISPTPRNPPRCRVCTSGFTDTPGASCPACGRVFAPLPMPPGESDFRQKPERFRFDGPGWVIAGLVLLCGVFVLASQAPGVLILLLILVLPAALRTSRLDEKRPPNRAFSILASFIAALGVSILMGVAAGAASFAVCNAIARGNGIGMLAEAFAAGGITAIVVFVSLFVAFLPRRDTSSKHDHGED